MVAIADIDKAMSQISDIELALDRKDARIKELEEEVGRLTAERNDSVIEAAAMGIANGHLHSLLEEQGIRLTLADKLAEEVMRYRGDLTSLGIMREAVDAYREGKTT